MSERNYQFRQRLLQVHTPNRKMPYAQLKEGQIEILECWSIYIPHKDDPVLYRAARDLEDYFAVSMGLCLRVQIGGSIPENAIVYRVDPALEGTQYRLQVTDNQVILSGGTNRTAAQAGYYLEDLMNLEEGPYLALQDTVKQPLYRTRMTHSGYGLDNYPDQYLNAIAHAGFTAIVLFVRGYNQAAKGHQDFNDLIHRAANYGLDVYMYSYIKSLVYPEGEEGKAYYDQTYGTLFRRCPGLKGLVLVGESCEFHSRDERTSGMFRTENLLPDGTRKVTKPNPGWWPCSDYPLLVSMIREAMRTGNPQAELVLWTYNWSIQPEEPRLELIQKLPKDIIVQSTFEKNAKIQREGIVDNITDYALYYEGPGDPFDGEAREAGKQGIDLYAMTNTAGATWDMGVIPYVPAPGQWLRRIQKMRQYHDNCGLCGLMESHHYGFYPSFISDLVKWMFHSPDTPEQEILHQLAAREFSPETADLAVEAWEEFSCGIRHTVTCVHDQYGPYRVGPGYPLTMEKPYKLPSEPYAYFGGNIICDTKYPSHRGAKNIDDRLPHELNYAKLAMAHYDRGADILDSLIPRLPDAKQANARRIANLGRFMARCAETTINTKLWYMAKKAEDWQEMLRIGQKELDNARRALPLVEYDSRLGYEPSMEYMADPAHIQWKMEVTRQVMDEEIAPLLETSDAK